MKYFTLLLFLVLPLFSAKLSLYDKKITATTSSAITDIMNPMTQKLSTDLTMKNNDPLTISGFFTVEMDSFMSDQLERDEAMKETLEAEDFKTATFTITKIEKNVGNIERVEPATPNEYLVTGIMLFHGVEREMVANAQILVKDDKVSFTATSMMHMSDHGVKMPCLLFVCVEDKVDLLVEASFIIDETKQTTKELILAGR